MTCRRPRLVEGRDRLPLLVDECIGTLKSFREASAACAHRAVRYDLQHMRKAAVRLFLLLLALATPLGAAPHKARKNLDLADTVDNTVILSKFAGLVQASDLGTFLSSRGPFTLFVPTNSAFSKLPPGMYEDLLRP